MSDELIFYTNPMSRGRVVRWMLEEVAQPYRTEVIAYGDAMKSPQYLSVNPMGKVPAIVHEGKTVTETAAICAYLADAFPEAGLAPPSAQRDQYYRWLFYFAGPYEAAVINETLGLEVPAEREVTVGYGSYETVMQVVEARLSASPYIAGDSFTAADVYCGSQIGWGLRFGSIEKRPAFASYFARLADRAAYVRATGIDDAQAARQAESQ